MAHEAHEPMPPWLLIGGKALDALLSTKLGRLDTLDVVPVEAVESNDNSAPMGASVTSFSESFPRPFFALSWLMRSSARLFSWMFFTTGKLLAIQASSSAVGSLSPVAFCGVAQTSAPGKLDKSINEVNINPTIILFI